jgi:hypothetical protein
MTSDEVHKARINAIFQERQGRTQAIACEHGKLGKVAGIGSVHQCLTSQKWKLIVSLILVLEVHKVNGEEYQFICDIMHYTDRERCRICSTVTGCRNETVASKGFGQTKLNP